jgi:hypothetical protein
MTMHKTASILLALTTAVGLTGCGLASRKMRVETTRHRRQPTGRATNPPQACEGKRLPSATACGRPR